MRRISIVMAAAVVAWISWAALTLPPPAMRRPLPAAAAGGPTVVRGVYHVHSRASDGTGTVPEIAAAAARAGLRFVIVTDHGNGFRRPAPPRYIAGVLCVEAVEISTTDGHYAALGMAPPPYPLGGEARDVVDDVARLGGFGVAAHPDSAKRALRWDAWDAPFDAMEWFNADSQWRDEPRWRLLPILLQYPWRRSESVASLFDRPDGLLRRWDELTTRRRVVGLAAADAHARMGLGGKTDPYDELLYVRVPSYESIFRAFSLGVELQAPLSGDALADAGAVLAAIRSGRVYAAFDAIAGPAVLSFTAESGGHLARQGEDLAFGGPVRFLADTNAPPGSSLVLFRNGAPVYTGPGPEIVWTGDRPGTYRVEAHVPGAPGDPPLPWIVSNPIYVGMPPQQGREGAPAVHARLVLPAGSWQIEKDPASSGSFDTAASGDLVRHTFRFQLGRQGSQSPFVALVTRDVGPLHDAARVAFRAAATQPLRLSVQVRLVEGAREQRWQRSIYLAPEPRDVVVSFDDMRTAGASERRPFQPAQIESLLLVFDTVNARPGDGGVIWIEGLCTER